MSLAAAMMNIQAYVRDMGNVPGYEDDDQLIASAPPVPPDGGSPGMITIGDLRRIVEAHALNRWNIEEDGAALLICRGLHEKGEPCEVERYVPEAMGLDDGSKTAEYLDGRMKHWIGEAQRLAALVTALGGNPEPGAPQPVDPVGQERRRTPNAEFPDGVMDHTRRRLEGIDALWEANGQPDHGQIAFLLRLGRSYVQMPKVDDLARERAEICRALGCVDKPGVPKEFILKLIQGNGDLYHRVVELIRSWDPATPTERQELDRMRRGWGPSTPTERNRRHNDVKRCLSVLSGAMTELQVGEEEADEISEEARDRIDLAYERLDKRHTEMLAIVEALNKEPMEWPDIKAAEERGGERYKAERDSWRDRAAENAAAADRLAKTLWQASEALKPFAAIKPDTGAVIPAEAFQAAVAALADHPITSAAEPAR